jgi:hypothetical protein
MYTIVQYLNIKHRIYTAKLDVKVLKASPLI